jgi:hypothetical protein
MDDTRYSTFIADLITFDEAVSSSLEFQQFLVDYEINDIPITFESEFQNFVYYVLHRVYGSDKIAYFDVEDFKKRMVETFYQDGPLLQKKWQLIYNQLKTNVNEAKFELTSETESQVDADNVVRDSVAYEDTSLSKNADTPTKLYSTPQQFVDQFTNSMNETTGRNTKDSETLNEATSTATDTTKGGLIKLFETFSKFPKSVVMMTASAFAHHFVSIYFD